MNSEDDYMESKEEGHYEDYVEVEQAPKIYWWRAMCLRDLSEEAYRACPRRPLALQGRPR